MIVPIFYMDFDQNEVHLGSCFMVIVAPFRNCVGGAKLFEIFLMQNLSPGCDGKTHSGI